jgi:2-C-methyl-D-erythritol 4-phosphate cytidylyltransferase
MKRGILIAAGGSGQRFGADKLLAQFRGQPVLIHSLRCCTAVVDPKDCVLVAPVAALESYRQILDTHGISDLRLVAGGSERAHSVVNGLRALDCELVAVHDAARPLLRPDTLRLCFEQAEKNGSAVLAHPVTDTIKIVDAENRVLSTPPRASLRAAETPQIFPLAALLAAYQKALDQGMLPTDEAMAMELAGHAVHLVLHQEDNRKITYLRDLE